MDAASQFVSPADFHSGLLALGFNVTQEEAEVLANVLETDEAGNINLASLQQEGSPLVEQLAALAGAAPEAGPPAEEEAAPAAEPQPTEAALAAIDALERGDEVAFADAIGRMPPAEAEALQQALALQQDQPTEAAAVAPPPSTIPRAKPKPQRSVSPPKRAVTYGKLSETFPVTNPNAESSASRDYGAALANLQPRSKSPTKIHRRASASSREASPSGSASRSPLVSLVWSHYMWSHRARARARARADRPLLLAHLYHPRQQPRSRHSCRPEACPLRLRPSSRAR
jgi:hypothetical protein